MTFKSMIWELFLSCPDYLHKARLWELNDELVISHCPCEVWSCHLDIGQRECRCKYLRMRIIAPSLCVVLLHGHVKIK